MSTHKDYVILVDEQDRVLGKAEKMLAHQKAWCHRAFSVFVYRKDRRGSRIEFLLQQRHIQKYHCGGLWTNTCCSHPRPLESVLEGAKRRLKEEMSIQVELVPAGAFHYIAHFENGLTENEYDHVLLGEWGYDLKKNTIEIDPLEIQDYAWVSTDTLYQQLLENPAKFTPWFKPAFQLALEKLESEEK